jgi:sugar O-acyltransferase (sialic acid O-acetyltransferase NeuD family)
MMQSERPIHGSTDGRPALAIVGAGGHGRVVADCAEACGWRSVVFFDNARPSGRNGDWPIEGTEADLRGRRETFDGFVIGVGRNDLRLAMHLGLVDLALPDCTLIHPRAAVSRGARIEPGSVVFAGGCINVGAHVGRAVIINTGATVDHDCVLHDGVHVSPGAHLAGGVTVGERSWIGIGAVVRQGIVIGRDAIIGAGAVVVANVPDGVTVVGNPARPLER